MKLYLAGYEAWKMFFNECKCLKEINFLETYLYFTKKWILNDYDRYKKKFFLDSWAFTAFTQKKNISLEAYCNFIKNNLNFLELYANLDVIWNAEETYKNQKIMEEWWLFPLPTYHYWEPKEYFEKYVKEYNYIGIWWLVPHARKPENIRKILDYCFDYIIKNWLKTKIHWRWMTNSNFMKKYPFYSIDSTWWLAWWKFNTIYFYKNWILTSNHSAWIRKKLKIDFWKVSYQKKDIMNIEALYKYIDYITRLHKVKQMEYRK